MEGGGSGGGGLCWVGSFVILHVTGAKRRSGNRTIEALLDSEEGLKDFQLTD